jgi:acyl carrier protein phosphodiesterase
MVVKKLSCTNCIFKVMNYLAHAYLSYQQPHILVGNMISDFVKGARKSLYAVTVQQGIDLHRAIDSFTDEHPATAAAKNIFRADYRLYSGPIVDIIYDHFLATDENEFSDASLLAFTQEVYALLEAEAAHLPPEFLVAFTYMKRDNWLYHYRLTKGIDQSLRGLARRAAYMNDSAKAVELLLTHYGELKRCYQAFFPDVKQMAKQKLASLLA